MKAEETVGARAGLPVTAENGSSSTWTASCWLLFAVAVVHHSVLWIDHVLWDEISFDKMSETGDLSGKISSLTAQGLGAAYPFYALFAQFSAPTHTLRVCSFLSIWILAVVVYRVLRLHARLPVAQAFGASLVMITFPAFQMYANAGAVIYVIHTAIFAIAASCYFAGCSGSEKRRWWLPLAAVLWIVSFTFQALLVYFYAFFVALALSRSLNDWRQHWRSIPHRASLVRIHVLLWIMPLLHYFLQKSLFPLHPYFASWYSQPRLLLAANLRDGLIAIDSSLLAPIRGLIAQGLVAWLIIIFAGLLLRRVLRILTRQVTAEAMEGKPVATARLALAGLVLLAAGLFPFVVTGKPPSSEGPETRYAILVAPSLAVLTAGCLAGIARITSRRLRSVFGFLGCSLLTGFVFLHARVYVDWQAAAIKDHAIILALRTLTPPPNVNFFIVTGSELEHRYVRRHYDWGYVLHKAWGGYDRSGEMFDRRGPTDRHYYTPIGMSREKLVNFREWMGFGSPGPPDSWCTLEFHTAESFAFGSNPWRVVAIDLWYRVRGNTKDREKWLREFIPSIIISPPTHYAFGAEALTQQLLQWGGTMIWRQLTPLTQVSIKPAHLALHVHDSIKGRFSVMPIAEHGFAIRCDSLPDDGTPAVVNIELRPSVMPEKGNRNHGIACDVHAFGSASLPRLFLVTIDKETEGVRPQPDLDTLEAWVLEPPLRSWIIWTSNQAGAVVLVKNISYGSTAGDSGIF